MKLSHNLAAALTGAQAFSGLGAAAQQASTRVIAVSSDPAGPEPGSNRANPLVPRLSSTYSTRLW